MPTDQEFIASVEALAPHVGTKRVVEDEVGLSMARRIAGMLDEDPDVYHNGAELPPQYESPDPLRVLLPEDLNKCIH